MLNQPASFGFREVRLKDKKLFERYLPDTTFSSDLAFSNVYNWDLCGQTPSYYCIFGDELIIKTVDLISKTYIYLVTPNISERIFEKLLNENLVICIPHSLPKFTSKYKGISDITEDVGNFDYIYNTANFVGLEGSGYKSIRKKVKKFIMRNSGHRYEIYRPIDSKNNLYDEITSAYETWIANKKLVTNKVEKYEYFALKKLLKHSNIYDIELIKIYEHDKLISFGTLELFPKYSTGLASFLKADIHYEGLGVYTYFLLSSHLHQLGYKYLNCEQDLGMSNLRFFKEQLRPTSMIKKYIIKKRRNN